MVDQASSGAAAPEPEIEPEPVADEGEQDRHDGIGDEPADEDPVVEEAVELGTDGPEDGIERSEDRHGGVARQLEADVDVEDEPEQEPSASPRRPAPLLASVENVFLARHSATRRAERMGKRAARLGAWTHVDSALAVYTAWLACFHWMPMDPETTARQLRHAWRQGLEGIALLRAAAEALHPALVHATATEGLLLFIVMALSVRRFGFRKPGLLGGIFVLGYALARTFCEFFREPDRQLGFLFRDHVGPMGGGVTMGMLLCVPMMIVVLTYIVLAATGRTRPRHPVEAPAAEAAVEA